MIVIALDCADEGLRGFLTRWLLEIKPNCFIGNVNASVREQLWEGIIEENRNRYMGAVMAYSMNTEQGFDIRMTGDPKRFIQDFEGIKLITYGKPSARQTVRKEQPTNSQKSIREILQELSTTQDTKQE